MFFSLTLYLESVLAGGPFMDIGREFAITSVLGVSGSYLVHEMAHILTALCTPGVERVDVSISWFAISVQPAGRMSALGIFFGAVSGPFACLFVGVVVVLLGFHLGWVYVLHVLFLLPFFGDGRAVLTAVGAGGLQRRGHK